MIQRRRAPALDSVVGWRRGVSKESVSADRGPRFGCMLVSTGDREVAVAQHPWRWRGLMHGVLGCRGEW